MTKRFHQFIGAGIMLAVVGLIFLGMVIEAHLKYGIDLKGLSTTAQTVLSSKDPAPPQG